MSAVERLKAATAALNADEQYELFRWWIESDAFKRKQLASLKRDIEAGLECVEEGHYEAYSEANVMQLAEEVSRSGRTRLAKPAKNSEG